MYAVVSATCFLDASVHAALRCVTAGNIRRLHISKKGDYVGAGLPACE